MSKPAAPAAEPEQKASTTSASAFVARTRIELPIPGPAGDRLACLIQPIGFEDLLEQTKRLPGAVPTTLIRKKRALVEQQDRLMAFTKTGATPEELAEIRIEIEQIVDESMQDWKALRPQIEAIVRLAVVEPRFTFEGEPDREDAVPWRLLDVRNQMALFNGIMLQSGYEGGAVEKTEGFRDGEQGGGAGGV